MLRYERLRRRSQWIKSLTGLTRDEFEELLERFLPAWDEAERQRLSRPNRQRAIGAGNQYKHDAATLLLMTLMWLRLYLTTEALGALFDVHKATVSRNGRRVLGVLRRIRPDEARTWSRP